MKNRIIIVLLIFISINVFGQTSDRTYLRHDHNYGNIYTYGITEFTIHPDSTFTSKSWFVFNKKDWKSYKNNEPEISVGKIKQNGKFYTLTEYRNGNKTDFTFTVKISEKQMSFYSTNEKGKFRKTAKYKRIE